MEFIQRYQPTADEMPPWAGISFKHPVDSDALAEQLKRAYPKCRTLRERKHQAAIDFLLQELERMRTKDSATPTVITSVDLPFSERHQDESKAYIEISSDHSRPQSASDYTSPSLSGSIPSPGMADRARLTVSTGANPGLPGPSTPTTKPQQFVWDSHNGQSLRPKTKRKMTLEERKAYKKTREQGACDACRKQKARCTHITDGGTPPTAVEQTNQATKRTKPTGRDIEQPEALEFIKCEQDSEARTIIPEERQPRQSSVPTSHKNHDRMHESVEPVAESMLNHVQWEDGSGSDFASLKSASDGRLRRVMSTTSTKSISDALADVTTDTMVL